MHDCARLICWGFGEIYDILMHDCARLICWGFVQIYDINARLREAHLLGFCSKFCDILMHDCARLICWDLVKSVTYWYAHVRG